MVRYISLLLFIGLAWGQEYDPETGEVVKKQYEQLGYEQADEHIQYGEWKNVWVGYWTAGFLAIAPIGAIGHFFEAQEEVKWIMDDFLENNKGGLNVNVDMMTDDEKTLYISGYEKK